MSRTAISHKQQARNKKNTKQRLRRNWDASRAVTELPKL